MSNHRYDNPDLMPREFLLAVMHDTSMTLRTRMNVAVQILKLDKEAGLLDDPSVPQVLIHVEYRRTDVHEAEDTWPSNHGPEVKVH